MWTSQQAATVPIRLLEWYRMNARPMPWHDQPDPYHVLVAATMLQQTQVGTVLPYLQRFLERFPDVCTLAKADDQEVLRIWAGLGYYARARNLHRAAQRIMQQYDGTVPCCARALRQLPGVGEYTAGAVASIACGQPEPALDANGLRILSRLLLFEEDISRAANRRKLWQACREIIPHDSPGKFNQALMDLGASICTARSPKCSKCPLQGVCSAYREGKTTLLPIRPAPPPAEKVQDVCLLVEHEGLYLLMKRQIGRLWKDMWEFPRVRLQEGETIEQAALRAAESLGLQVDLCQHVGAIRHAVMHYTITLHAMRCRLCVIPEPAGDTVRWLPLHDAQQLPLTAPARRLAERLAVPSLL